MKKKDLQKYDSEYGNIPKNFFDRFNMLIEVLNLKKNEINKLQESIRKLLKAKWHKLEFVIYYTPLSTPRPRSGRGGRFYVKGAADNSKAFETYIKTCKHDFGVISTPTKMVIDAYFPIPNGMNRMEKILAELKLLRPISKPDWDNIGKTYSDMIQKHLLLEDCTIIDGRTRKYYSSKPRVELTIEYMDKYDCKFHKNRIEKWSTYNDSIDKIDEKNSII